MEMAATRPCPFQGAKTPPPRGVGVRRSRFIAARGNVPKGQQDLAQRGLSGAQVLECQQCTKFMIWKWIENLASEALVAKFLD